MIKFSDFIGEGKAMPRAIGPLIKEAKQLTDELAAALAKVKELESQVGSYSSEIVRRMEEAGQSTVKAGKVLAILETKQGRASYSYKEAETLYYDALMRVNKQTAAATKAAVEALKKVPADKKVLKIVSEGVASTVVEWFKALLGKLWSALGLYGTAVDDLEALVSTNESVNEGASAQDLKKLYRLGKSTTPNDEYEKLAIAMFGKGWKAGVPAHVYDAMSHAKDEDEFVKLMRSYSSVDESIPSLVESVRSLTRTPRGREPLFNDADLSESVDYDPTVFESELIKEAHDVGREKSLRSLEETLNKMTALVAKAHEEAKSGGLSEVCDRLEGMDKQLMTMRAIVYKTPGLRESVLEAATSIPWEKRTVEINHSTLVAWRNSIDGLAYQIRQSQRNIGGRVGDKELDKFSERASKIINGPSVEKLRSQLDELESNLTELGKLRCYSQQVNDAMTRK